VCGTLSDGAHHGGGLNGQDAYTGRILPVVPYDLFQITAPLNRQSRDERSPCHTLARDNAAHAAVVQPLAFDARQTDVCVYGDKTGPLDTDPGTIGVCVTGDRTHSLTTRSAASEDGTGRGTPIVPSGMSVRRLTPPECERLQGFPDNYTLIPITKRQPIKGQPEVVKMAADGPRYKALGNSMAVPCMRWIGERIAEVEAL
jgi:DNA (cytosine-5)-methyltransferase 1